MSSKQRQVAIGDFLTEADMRKAERLYPNAKAICREVIEPKMDEINRKLGQENDPMYLAYAVVYAIDTVSRRSRN